MNSKKTKFYVRRHEYETQYICVYIICQHFRNNKNQPQERENGYYIELKSITPPLYAYRKLFAN